jgi:ribose transport system permease protein
MMREIRNSAGKSVARSVAVIVDPRQAVFLVLILLLATIFFLNPGFAEPSQFIRFVQRVAPIAILTMGQFFVLVSGEFDLSVGALIAVQVVVAGNLIGQDESKSIPVLILMFFIGLVVGLVNGLVSSLLRVPSFVVTLGMMLVLLGGVYFVTGGSASGNPADGFRSIGRGGIEGFPIFGLMPWAVIVLIVCTLLASYVSTRPFGKTLIAIGDNPETQFYSGARVWWTKTQAFMISSTSATVAGILLVGYAGVHPSVGRGYEFIAITAAVLGGVVLGGGRGWVLGALAGAFTLEALFTVLNFADVPSTWRDSVQGIIIIAAVAYSAVSRNGIRRKGTNSASPEIGEGASASGRSAQNTSPSHD